MAIEQPDLFSELPSINRFDRIDTLERIEGFLPVSNTEQTEVMNLQNFIHRPSGAASHLAGVIRQHGKSPEVTDAGRAARKITHDYVRAALDAQKSIKDMELLKETLSGVYPTLIMKEVMRDDGEYVDPSEPGILPFLRFFDLSLLRQDKGMWRIGFDPQRVAYKPDNPGIVFYANEAMAVWKVRQVAKKLPVAMEDQAERFTFFTERLTEVIKYSDKKLKAVAHQGLDKIYGRTEVE